MNDQNLTNGKIGSKILILALPLIITNLMQVSYNFIDMYFIGSYLPNGEGLSALGTAGNYMWLCTSYILLATIGTQILIGQNFGANKISDVKKYAINGIFLTFVLALLYSLIVFIFNDELIAIFNLTSDIVFDYATSYLRILSVGLFFLMMSNVFIAIFQALGNTRIILIVSGIGVIINIVLDPIFITVLDFGVNGAAIATSIGSFVSFLIYALLIVFKTDLIRGKIILSFKKMVDILRLSIFIALQNIFFTLSAMVVAAIILKYGEDALAAQRVGNQIESFTWMIGIGISTTISVFTAQNFGAKRIDRINTGYYFTLKIMTIYGLLITLLLAFKGDSLISLFTESQEIIAIGATYLFIISFSQIFQLYEGICGGVFNGMSETKYVAIFGISGNVLRIILVIILSEFIGLNGIWIAISVSSIYKGALLLISLSVYKKKNFKLVK